MNQVIDSLKQNLQLLYRKALDADARLDQLSAQGKGKFQQIFPAHAGFSTDNTRFSPYVAEVAEQVLQIEQAIDTPEPELIADTVKKMELLFSTLANFSASLKS